MLPTLINATGSLDGVWRTVDAPLSGGQAEVPVTRRRIAWSAAAHRGEDGSVVSTGSRTHARAERVQAATYAISEAASSAASLGELFAASEILGGEEFERAPDPAMRSVYRKILTLSTAQKALLALKGGREERTILIRDTNKVVALAVLKNPRLNEQEVESVAAMRNVSDEVLRAIGSNREWSKVYQVAAALVRNPRTPPGVSTNFIPRLTERDLKLLAKDKNVPADKQGQFGIGSAILCSRLRSVWRNSSSRPRICSRVTCSYDQLPSSWMSTLIV